MGDALRYAVVVPTVGRPSLARLLAGLEAQRGHVCDGGPQMPTEVYVVDDRPTRATPSVPLDMAVEALPVQVLRTGGRGPAAARNAGWRSATTPWVAFLDDDVELPEDWVRALHADLLAAGPAVGGIQGRIEVPLPPGRRPTDWERSTAGLERARWATADMAYRREALDRVHGFDERFPRAFREDADLAARVAAAGWLLVRGKRRVVHPVRPSGPAASLRVQAGNADDATMRALHGPRWRAVSATGRGRLPWHAVTVAAGAVAVVAGTSGRTRLARLGAITWCLLTVEFLARRVLPGPRPGDPGFGPELRRMTWTSVAVPVAAVVHRVRGQWRVRHGLPSWPPPVRAVLFDRDGTLVHDVPYNGDPAAVRPVDGAREVLDALRARGVLLGVVTNQSGIARGLLSAADVEAVDAEVERLLGPFDSWQVCPHEESDRCTCRKPAPGMILSAARELDVAPWECAVVGDIEADVLAARAAGALGVLVPTRATLPDEVDRSRPLVATSLAGAIDLMRARLGDRTRGRRRPRWTS
jgi:HAD superfamily hydrolase (TIGR01662 family)